MKELLSKSTETFRVVLKLSDDRMKVFLYAEPTGGPASIARADLEKAIDGLVPADLLNLGVLDDVAQALSRAEKVEDRRIAKGTEPTPGLNGRLVFLVKRYVERRSGASEGGEESGSLRDLHLFDNIRKGTVVARLYPPKAGTDGRDALGKAVPAKAGQPLKVQSDKTIALRSESAEEPFQALVASLDGYLVEESGAISIKEELAIKGNVDFHVGNVDFVGSVLVRGDVLTGFSVKADKNITINGSVQGATIESRLGDVAIKQFLFGGGKGAVLARGAFSCATAREATVEVAGNLSVTKEAYGCVLRTQSAITAERARLIGGHILSVCGVDALQLGNEAGLPTIVELCSDIEMSTEFATLVATIAAHRKAQKLVELHLGPYATNSSRISLLKDELRTRIEGLLKKKRDVDQSLVQLLAKQQKMLEQAKVAQVLRVSVRKMLYPGVVIRAGDVEFAPKEAVKGPCSIEYLAAEKKFTTGELKALECTLAPANSSSTTAQTPPVSTKKG